MACFSNEEVAQYLTTFKTYEHRGGDSLKEPIHQTYTEQLAHVMTSGKKVNKTDTDNLASQFGVSVALSLGFDRNADPQQSFANISKQPSKVLSGVKGLGATKVTSLVDAFTKPFLVGGLKRGESSSQPTNPLSAAGASRVDGPGAEVPPPAKVPSPVGSPDWPDEDPEDEEAEAPVISPSIPRDRAPSRSPGLSPEAAPLDGEGEDRAGVAVWKDPLEDDEDEDDEDEGPAPKRSRLDV
jgi:DNA excision repair protein ERCC-1